MTLTPNFLHILQNTGFKSIGTLIINILWCLPFRVWQQWVSSCNGTRLETLVYEPCFLNSVQNILILLYILRFVHVDFCLQFSNLKTEMIIAKQWLCFFNLCLAHHLSEASHSMTFSLILLSQAQSQILKNNLWSGVEIDSLRMNNVAYSATADFTSNYHCNQTICSQTCWRAEWNENLILIKFPQK